MGRYGEIWGGTQRRGDAAGGGLAGEGLTQQRGACNEMWADVGRCGESWRAPAASRPPQSRIGTRTRRRRPPRSCSRARAAACRPQRARQCTVIVATRGALAEKQIMPQGLRTHKASSQAAPPRVYAFIKYLNRGGHAHTPLKLLVFQVPCRSFIPVWQVVP